MVQLCRTMSPGPHRFLPVQKFGSGAVVAALVVMALGEINTATTPLSPNHQICGEPTGWITKLYMLDSDHEQEVEHHWIRAPWTFHTALLEVVKGSTYLSRAAEPSRCLILSLVSSKAGPRRIQNHYIQTPAIWLLTSCTRKQNNHSFHNALHE